MSLTAKRLRHLLDYDPLTGIFTWRVARGRCGAGAQAGSPGTFGYIQIMVDRVNRKAHRLAWLWVNGKWPTGEIDHINGVTGDNRIANLREASSTQQKWNKRGFGAAGLKGAFLDKRDGRWYSKIVVGGRIVHLGRFASAVEAHAAYAFAANEYFGEFACLTR